MNAYTLVITQGDPRFGDQRENEVRRIERTKGLSYHQAIKEGNAWHKLGHWVSVYDADGALVAEMEGDECHD